MGAGLRQLVQMHNESVAKGQSALDLRGFNAKQATKKAGTTGLFRINVDSQNRVLVNLYLDGSVSADSMREHLKSLGASNRGVMMIFLGYGLLLGLVGASLGTTLGLVITDNINEIEAWLSRRTGQQIFDRKVYYFDSIPTYVSLTSVLLVNAGAVAIAVAFSILPALRAAMLHPVRALRYE